MIELRVHAEALEELVDAVEYYESRSTGAGLALLKEVARVWTAIRHRPGLGAKIEPPYRRYVCDGFPFDVVYREVPGEVRVLALKHHRRRPGYWRTREPRGRP